MQRIVDLTHTLSEKIPFWDGSCGFEIDITLDYKDSTPPDLFRTQKIKMNAGIGTHIDAPAHCIEGGKTIERLSMDELVVDCVVIDVSASADENYVVSKEVVENFERNNGIIKENTFIIIHTGWEKYWNESLKYVNNHNFPSVSKEAGELFVSRNIAGLGIDTLSVDTGHSGFPVHRSILGAGKYLVENVANASKLPTTGAKIFIMPMKIEGATEAPVRLVAML